MNMINFKEGSIRELTYEEERSINGGRPDKTTSFWYDVSYYTTHALNKALNGGILSLSYWEDWSISLIS